MSASVGATSTAADRACWPLGFGVLPVRLGERALVTGDMAATATGILAFYAFWRWLRPPSWGGALVTGLLLGIAELAKFVWIMLFLLWPVLWIAWRWLHRDEAGPRSLVREIGQGLAISVIAVYAINLGYLFGEPLHPLAEFSVAQGREAVGECAANRQVGRRHSAAASRRLCQGYRRRRARLPETPANLSRR